MPAHLMDTPTTAPAFIVLNVVVQRLAEHAPVIANVQATPVLTEMR